MSMQMRFNEGDIVLVKSPDGEAEPGFIFTFNRRGCAHVYKAVGFLKSGRFKSLPEGNRNKVAGFTLHLIEADPFIYLKRVSYPKQGFGEAGFRWIPVYTAETFTRARHPFLGKLTKRKDQLPMSLTAVTKYLLRHNLLSPTQLNRRENEFDLTKITQFVKAANDRRSDGIWMNPIVTRKALGMLGIPNEFLRCGRKSVTNYDQCIIHVDGTDSARTLGMHQDRDQKDRKVATILGCIGAPKGCGKDMIVWKGTSSEGIPHWWRNEGLSRECFELAKRQCLEVEQIRQNTTVITIHVGEFIFMPKGLWHWACPSDGANWSAMITSSIY